MRNDKRRSAAAYSLREEKVAFAKWVFVAHYCQEYGIELDSEHLTENQLVLLALDYAEHGADYR